MIEALDRLSGRRIGRKLAADRHSALPSAEAASLAGPGDSCRLQHNDAMPWDWGAPLPQRLWRVTKIQRVSFQTHEPAKYGWGTLSPGDLLRYETTYWYEQGCCNESNICDRFVVLTGELAGHCVSTWGFREVDRSMIEPVATEDHDVRGA